MFVFSQYSCTSRRHGSAQIDAIKLVEPVVEHLDTNRDAGVVRLVVESPSCIKQQPVY